MKMNQREEAPSFGLCYKDVGRRLYSPSLLVKSPPRLEDGKSQNANDLELPKNSLPQNDTAQTSNRKYKDSVFVDLFAKDRDAKKNFLALYNALHQMNLNLEDTTIEPVMLEQVLYMSYYNDVSMLVDGRLVILIEHQSTINANMPLRFLEYVTHLYEKAVPSRSKFSRTLVKIPRPEFYVFYNGTEELPEEMELRLSDSFDDDPKARQNTRQDENTLELLVKVYNINKCKDISLLKKCRPLEQYSEFVALVREAEKSPSMENPFDWAIKKCIERGILSDYLSRKSTEVINMLFTEYDYATDIAVQREEEHKIAYEDGKQEGKLEGRLDAARNLLKLNILTNEQIAQTEELPIEQVGKLAEEMKSQSSCKSRGGLF